MRIITLLLLLIPALSYSQVKPSKRDNTIIVTGSYRIEDIGRLMVLEGFEIEKLDKELNYLTTNHADLSKTNKTTYKVKVVIKDNKLDIIVFVLNNWKSKSVKDKLSDNEEKANYTALPSVYRDAFMKTLDIFVRYAKDKGGEVKTEKR